MLLDFADESLQEPYCDVICAVIVLSVAWEVAVNLKVVSHVLCCSDDSLCFAVMDVEVTAENSDFCIFDCRK